MTTMNRNFWDKNAGRYDAFLARDAPAYERMVHLMHHTVQDMFNLPYADKSFDVVIVSNALHIVPHLGNGLFGKIRAFFLKLAGFPLYHRWSTESYLQFLQQNGWHIHKSLVLRASFPLTYAECTKA